MDALTELRPLSKFAIRNLSTVVYAQGWTQWHYRHAGPVAEVTEPGFFSEIADMVACGDFVFVSASDGAIILHVADIGRRSVVVEEIARTGCVS